MQRGVSIPKVQHNNVSYGCSQVVDTSSKSYVSSTHRKLGQIIAMGVSSGTQDLSHVRWRKQEEHMRTLTPFFTLCEGGT